LAMTVRRCCFRGLDLQVKPPSRGMPLVGAVR
jgi:hypothetical protein